LRQADPGGEATEAADHVVVPGGRHPRGDALHVGVGAVEVDAGVPVVHPQVVLSNTNFDELMSTGVGYSPDRQAVQNPSASVAARRPGSDRYPSESAPRCRRISSISIRAAMRVERSEVSIP